MSGRLADMFTEVRVMSSFSAPGPLGWILVMGCAAVASGAEPVLVVGPDSNPRQPQAAVTEEGTVYVVYGAGDSIHVSKSDDLESGFSAPAHVGDVKRLMLGMRRGPRIAAGREGLTVTAIARAGELLAWHSTDGSRTWSGPVTVNDEPTAAREGLHDLAIGPHGRLVCVWLICATGRRSCGAPARRTAAARGAPTSASIVRPTATSASCCHPSVAFDREGRVYALWRNALGGSWDMYLSTSRDGGRTFGRAEKLGAGTWKLDRCPMDGGRLAVMNPGDVMTLWRRDNDIFRTAGGRQEQRLGHGEQPWATATPEGAWLVWISGRPGDLWLLGPGEQHPTRLARHAADPVLASQFTGAGPVVAVWESDAGRSKEIRAAVVSNRVR